ncbi:MAG: hypothetical protein FOGNACKC_04381 [Anaerolineae bacterium]|nr:hypothetical protein [Anaerolineae bacterium]
MNTKRIVMVVILLALLLAALPAGAQNGGSFSLTVLHTNDVHARVDQFDSGGNTCDDEEMAANECFGGAARVKTAADQVRGEVANTILVDAGDQFQGTLFFNQYQGGEAQEMMGLLGYQAMTIGNHEFDSGPGTLGSFLRGVSFPVVSANIDASAEPELAGLIKPYTILEVGGEKIGVVGATTSETGILSSPGPNVIFNDVATSVQAAVDELAGQGINKIIALTHIGYNADQDLARSITGLDVIVGGHSHTLLSNTAEGAAGPYPTVVDAPDGSPVVIVQDGSYARALGRLNVTFNADGVVTEYSGDPIALDSSVAQDETVQARVDALKGPINALTEKVIGQAAVDLDGERTTCRFAECTMGNLITDAMLQATQGEGTQIAITNGGGIRASIGAGNVTLGDVLTVLPFGNLISTFDLTGAEVVQALENGVSRAENAENEGTGRFPQVAGLRYSWDPAQPVGSRITSVEVKNTDGSYSPIDLAATYKVASNDFMRGGGDGYEVFVTARNTYDFGSPLDEALQTYIAANSPVSPALEGRISQGEGAMMAEAPAMVEEQPMMATGACAQDYTVQADDWLSKIAEKFLGDPLGYTAIFEATNAAAAAGGSYDVIADPNVIVVGQVVCIPAQNAEGAMMAPEADSAAMAEESQDAHAEAPHWGYSGDIGPEFWGDLSAEYALCSTGASQSPIDIPADSATQSGEIQFNYQPTSLNSVVNNGHTIQVNYDTGSSIEVNGKTFNLAQFHFHVPSEHTEGGAPAAMEVHLVHKSDAGELAVVGIMLDEGTENPVLAQFWDQIPTEEATVALTGTVNVADILPADSPYYTYSGSLTTPPCSEGVNWFVMDQRGQVSQDQIDAFSAIIGPDARPTQPLNDRAISQ